MNKTTLLKVCIVASSLGGGGAEKVAAIQSKIFHDLGYDVHIISILNNIDYPYKGTLLNLGSYKDKDDSVLGRLKRFFIFRKYIKTNKFDYIIDHRSRNTFIRDLLISKTIYNNVKTIYMAHSHNLKNVICSKNKWVTKTYRSAFKIVTVSEKIKKTIEKEYNFNNVLAIYNPFQLDLIKNQSQEFVKTPSNYILYFGRLDDKVKNISLLIESYSISQLPQNKIKLLILGNGNDKNILEHKIKDKKLCDLIDFLPFTKNPYAYIHKAKFTVLTSRYEGFPMVIPESLACGTPVISVDCESGPNEIIQHKHNGLLVENHQEKSFAKAMDSFIFDHKLYENCKENSEASVKHLDMSNITKQWKELLENK